MGKKVLRCKSRGCKNESFRCGLCEDHFVKALDVLEKAAKKTKLEAE